MKKFKVIVNVNLEYDFDAKDEDDAIEQVENVELPDSYVEDSFEVVKVFDETPAPPKFITFVR